MAISFVGGNGHGVGKIQAANRIMHRYPQQLIWVGLSNGVWQATGFTTKYICVVKGIFDFGIGMLRVFAEQPHAICGQAFEQCFPVIHGLPNQMLPVIEASAPQMMFIDSKTEWPDQPELGLERNTSPADIPRILRDFGLMQDDMAAKMIAHITIKSITPRNASGCRSNSNMSAMGGLST